MPPEVTPAAVASPAAAEAAPDMDVSEQDLSTDAALEEEETPTGETSGDQTQEEEIDETALLDGLGLDSSKTVDQHLKELLADREAYTGLKGKHDKLAPILQERGMLDIDDLVEHLTSKPAPTSPKTEPGPAMSADKYVSDYLSKFTPEDQPGMKQFADFVFNHPAIKGAVNEGSLDNYAVALYESGMKQDYNQLVLDQILNHLSGAQPGAKFERFDAPYGELAKHIQTYHQTLIPRARREGKTAMALAYDFWRSQKGAPKPAGNNGKGMEAALKTEKPGTVGAGAKAQIPKKPDGSIHWDGIPLAERKNLAARLAKEGKI